MLNLKKIICKSCLTKSEIHECESVLKKSLKRINRYEYLDLRDNKKVPSISLQSKLFFIS